MPGLAVRRSTWITLLGLASAVAVTEMGLRRFVTPADARWGGAIADSAGVEIKEVRGFGEGIATAHVTRAHRRLTGTPGTSGGSIGLIIGDSYVEAAQVADDETMGAVLERALAGSGRRTAVWQFGWSAADIPLYVFKAPELLAALDPEWVVVVITANDLGPDLLTARVHLERTPEGRWRGAGVDPDRPVRSPERKVVEWVTGRSAIISVLFRKLREAGIGGGAAPARIAGAASTREGGLPLDERAEVALAALRDAYGPSVGILFIANVGVDGLREPSPAESAVARACERLQMRCANTRGAMARDRADSLRLSRGFVNTEPNFGHINAVGHRLAAETILTQLLP
jgi:hypothetical protein